MNDTAPIIHADNIEKNFAALKAVDGVSFDIWPNSCVGLLGPNGAGKTTTMRMMMGLTTPSAGRLYMFNQPLEALNRQARARIGLVPQDNNLDMDLSVEQNLWVYGHYYGLPKSYLQKRIPELLAFMALEDKKKAAVFGLSGGMKRRLIIARALISDPDIVILDEPTTGLDPQARMMIWHLLISLKKAGKTLLLTTHYMDEAARLCDNIVIIDAGRVLDEGTPQNLIDKHVARTVLEMDKSFLEPSPQAQKELERSVRYEQVGENYIIYTNTPQNITQALPPNAEYTQRSANLEDVFLCLTGRRLREA